MHKELVAAYVTGAATIIAAVIGIAPYYIRENKELESKYESMSQENNSSTPTETSTPTPTESNTLPSYESSSESYESSQEDSEKETPSITDNEDEDKEVPTTSPTTNPTIGWVKDVKGWKYIYEEGVYHETGWMSYDNSWYYFENGYMQVGWIKTPDGNYHYCDLNTGAMLVNQWTPDGYWVNEKGMWVPTNTQEPTINESMPSNIQSEQKVSIFTLDTFKGKGYWFDHSSVSASSEVFTDTYGNEYLTARFTYHGPSTVDSTTAPIYLLDKKYKLCKGEFAWSKKSKNFEGSVWIEFYSGNSLIYQTSAITADDRAVSFEFNVEGLDTLTIVRNGTNRKAVTVIYPYLDLVQ